MSEYMFQIPKNCANLLPKLIECSVILFLKRYCTQIGPGQYEYGFDQTEYTAVELTNMKWDCFVHVLNREEFIELVPYLNNFDKDELFKYILCTIEEILFPDVFNEDE